MLSKDNDLCQDMCKLLKDEGKFVKELTEVSTKAAEFHARLESIEKALESDPSSYSSEQADAFVQKAKDKYSSELEGKMKDNAYDKMKL